MAVGLAEGMNHARDGLTVARVEHAAAACRAARLANATLDFDVTLAKMTACRYLRRLAMIVFVVVIGCHKPSVAQPDAGTATDTPSASASASASAIDEPAAICEHGWQLDNAERTARGHPLDHSQSERKLAACRERFEHVRGDPAFPCMSRCMMNASDLRVFNACEHECGVPHGWGLH